MNGIDISRYQKGINLAAVPCDFVIVKASQGASNSVYPTFKEQITQADQLGKKLGVYHYASTGGAIAEAEKFLKTVKDYIGKAILCLDWEGDQNPNFGNPQYALTWLNYVEQKTGIKPFLYMSKSVARQYAKVWDPSFPFWCAQYANYQYTAYKTNPWTDNLGFGPWKDCKIFQYSSRGRLPGYNNDLDLDLAYMSINEWDNYAAGKIKSDPKPDPTKYPTLRKGDVNEYVRHWQIFLNKNGYCCGNTDSIFGQKTKKAVIKWQKDHPICGKPDGIIGPKTWASILN